ncbi:oxysterol-binding protein hes1 [Dermatophagoides pteronyssinus]|uniref:Oxysterol-binding protein hes1 n=1 Tax=Dermatophagoides pteronyssinus TaxID=6956 RepID=A0ABQ8J7V7_DERPT|nr:oxysterol-binding protein hes1 [Dermatophagoides pteronyssinus]
MTANHGTVESSTTELIRQKPMTKASEHRRITKPIMEKKRRARINNSLNELKALILDALNKDPSRHSKLEKADILEMTVRHLQKLQRQQIAATIVNDTTQLNKYRAGYSECANEVGRYMGSMDGVDQSLRQRILGHLNHCVNSLNQMAANNSAVQFGGNPVTKTVAFPGMIPAQQTNHLHVQIPVMFGQQQQFIGQNGTDINNNRTTFLDDVYVKHQSGISTTATTTTPPPSSASSSLSSHFAFNLHSPLSSPSSKPISLTTNDLFYRKNFHHQRQQHQSISPGSISYTSEHMMMSPIGSDNSYNDDQLDMAVDCTISKSSSSMNDENVWRPW